MSASTTVISTARPVAPSTTSAYGREFWEQLWRTAGIQSVGLFVIAYFVRGVQPQVAAVCAGLAILNLMWFAAAIRSTLAAAGQDGWGAALTASSAAFGAMFLLVVAGEAAVGYAAAGAANQPLASGLHNFVAASIVLTSFPRAMLIMSATFGLWRAGLISNAAFAVGVAAVILMVASGTTWLGGGVWSPDGVYARIVSPAIGLTWMIGASGVLLTRSPATRAAW